MSLATERTNYRLDKILTMFDASLGTSGSGAPYSVKEIVDTVTLGELVIGWDAHAVERNAEDTAWILGGDGTSWRLRITRVVDNDLSYWPMDGTFPDEAQIQIGEVVQDIFSFSLFGADFNTSSFIRYDDQPTLMSNGDALFSNGRLDGHYRTLLAPSIAQNVTFSGVIVTLDAAITPPTTQPVQARIATGDALNLVLSNPKEIWVQIVEEATFPTTIPDGTEAGIATFDKTMSVISRVRVSEFAVIRYQGEIWGVENVAQAGARGRFWQVGLRRRTSGVSV